MTPTPTNLLSGIYTALITPFTDNGDHVAYDDLERLAVSALDGGAAGLTALGTTGEPATLEEAEKSKVIEIVGAICRDRNAHFMVGAGSNNTKASVEAVVKAAEAGAESVLSVVPYYTRPSEAGIVAHFQTLAAASPVPLVVYNVPYRTGRNLGSASLLELAATPNIAGVKQAVGGVDVDSLELLAQKPEEFSVLCGDDAFIYPLLLLGGSGAISAPSNVCTRGFAAMVESAHNRDVARARKLHEALLPLCTVLFSEPNPAVVKAAAVIDGLISTPAVRAPMTPASATATQDANAVLQATHARLEALL